MRIKALKILSWVFPAFAALTFIKESTAFYEQHGIFLCETTAR